MVLNHRADLVLSHHADLVLSQHVDPVLSQHADLLSLFVGRVTGLRMRWGPSTCVGFTLCWRRRRPGALSPSAAACSVRRMPTRLRATPWRCASSASRPMRSACTSCSITPVSRTRPLSVYFLFFYFSCDLEVCSFTDKQLHFGDLAFSIAAMRLLSALPESISDCKSIYSFKNICRCVCLDLLLIRSNSFSWTFVI